jgi:hypothetical protein
MADKQEKQTKREKGPPEREDSLENNIGLFH